MISAQVTKEPVGYRAVAHVDRGLTCDCCKDRRTKRDIRRTVRRIAKQALGKVTR